MIFKTSQKRGFSLVELLFVVAIIGLISTTLLSSFEGAKRRSRDVRRVEDVRQIQAALQLYYNENGVFPGNLGSPPAGAPAYDSCVFDDTSFDNISTILTSAYMPSVPIPPRATTGGAQCYFYVVNNNKQGYYILMTPEDQSATGIRTRDDTGCPSASGNYYVVCVN